MHLTSFLFTIVIFNQKNNYGFGAKHAIQPAPKFCCSSFSFGEGFRVDLYLKLYQDRYKILSKLTIKGNGCTKMDHHILDGSQDRLYRLESLAEDRLHIDNVETQKASLKLYMLELMYIRVVQIFVGFVKVLSG